ncbi:MAG: hypothetical protein FWG99_05785 [Treponema sp.]|nr:hypothetical protein [Treponema sp.]
MHRIFWYELKRLMFNRLFLALLIITGLYSYMTLSREIILGVAFTAPFSPWSFSAYLAKILPLLILTLLFFITFIYSNHEKQVRQLTFATPVDPFKFNFVKYASIAAGFFVITLFVILMGMVFLAVLFRFYHFGDFIIPIAITIIPCFLFVIGAGLLLGGIQYNFLYVLMIAFLLPGFLPLPPFFDLYGGNFFTSHPLTLPTGLYGEPAFTLPASFILGRVCYSAAGVLMVLLVRKSAQKCPL